MNVIKNRNDKGRPPKTATEQHKYKITVRFATADYFSLKAKARETGMTLSDFLRSALSASVVRERLRPSHLRLIAQLTGMANNLNEIARRANAAGYRHVRGEYLHLADEMDNIIRLIRE